MEVKITKLDNFGRGIAYVNNKICFIPNTLQDEVVNIEIIAEKKKYLEGRLLSIKDASLERQKPKCPLASICGGCDLQHLSFSAENDFKQEKVKAILHKFLNLPASKVQDIIFSSDYNYRNKVTFHVQNKQIGFYEKNTNTLIEIDHCFLLAEKINNLLPILKQVVFKNNIEEIIIRVTNDEGQVMVKLIGDVTTYQELLTVVDVLYINEKIVTPKTTFITTIGPKKYSLSIASFFQINKTLTKNLYDTVKEEIMKANYSKVLDLYCGTGSIGLYLNDYVQELIGIDYLESNIKDANYNKDLNNAHNVTYLCAKVEDVITSFQNIDAIIVDPPRKGLDSKSKSTIVNIAPQKIIYVSCDLLTLARDLAFFQDKYEIDFVKPFNMFPKTYHVECICSLTKKIIDKELL